MPLQTLFAVVGGAFRRISLAKQAACVPIDNVESTKAAGVGPAVDIYKALDRWAAELRRRGADDANIRKPAKRLRTLFAEAGWTECGNITREAAVAVLQAQVDKGSSTTTAGNLQSLLNSFCKFLCEEGSLNFNPLATIPRPRRRKGPTRRTGMRHLTEGEVESLVRAAEADESKDEPEHLYERSVIYRVLALTGARYGQVVRSLRRCDIDLDARHIIFDATDAKNGSGFALPLHEGACAALREWLADHVTIGPRDWVFPKHVHPRVFDHDLKAAGIPKRGPDGRPAGFHSLRKTFASVLIRNGVAPNVAQRLLQHKTIAQTMEIYAEIMGDGLADGLSTIQLLSGSGVRTYEKKSSPASQNDLTGRGVFDDTLLHASRFPLQPESASSGGVPLDGSHYRTESPSDDIDSVLSGMGRNVRGRSPPPVKRPGVQIPPPRLVCEKGCSEEGGKNPLPLPEAAALILEYAVRILRQVQTGPSDADDSNTAEDL